MVTLVQQYFDRSAKRFPDKAGICCADLSSSFDQSQKHTNGVANLIRTSGVPRGSFIPFFMRKSIDSIHAILSILKSDCAYVPIDINFPANRIEIILKVTKAPLVIVNAESLALLNELIEPENRPPVLIIDEVEVHDTTQPVYQNLSIDIAYVLFTSGSTGVPKGVMIPHKAIIDYIDWCVTEYGISDSDRVANHAPLNFDNSTFDIYTAFASGASLHLVHDKINAVITSLIKWVRNNQITVFFCVPSVLALLLRTRRLKVDSFPGLRHLICAGEVLNPDVLREWMKLYPGVQFTNMYGPTEITVDCSFHVIRNLPSAGETTVPIGKPRPNMEMFVRLESGELSQQTGSKGELLVRGTSVAYGYLGDEEKTSRAFIQNPAHRTFHDPLYCTGDLVEIDPNGDYLFAGRIDDQVKFLGYRIELGEIESALNIIEAVTEAVVVFNESEKIEETGIGALINLTGMSTGELSDLLREKLPAYMVPTRIIPFADTFPRTANGKYDRKAILRLVFDPSRTGNS